MLSDAVNLQSDSLCFNQDPTVETKLFRPLQTTVQ